MSGKTPSGGTAQAAPGSGESPGALAGRRGLLLPHPVWPWLAGASQDCSEDFGVTPQCPGPGGVFVGTAGERPSRLPSILGWCSHSTLQFPERLQLG